MFEFGKDFLVNEFLLRVDAQYFRLAVYRICCSYCRFIVAPLVSLFLFLNIFIASLLKKSSSALRADEYASRPARSPNSSNDAAKNGSLFAKEHR